MLKTILVLRRSVQHLLYRHKLTELRLSGFGPLAIGVWSKPITYWSAYRGLINQIWKGKVGQGVFLSCCRLLWKALPYFKGLPAISKAR